MSEGLADSDKGDREARKPWTKTADWQLEYQELSEDFRHLRTIGWQAPFAVLALDGVLLVPAIDALKENSPLAICGAASLMLVGGLFTLFIGIDVFKWIRRGDVRVERLEKYERQAGFGRYFPKE